MSLKTRFVIFLILALTRTAASITVDGDFNDWQSMVPISTGLNSEMTGDAGSGINDIQSVWAANDRHYLYISILCAQPIIPGQWSPPLISLDTDMDASTGFPSPAIGVDYLVQPSTDLDGSILVHKRIIQKQSNEWSQWLSPTVVEAGFHIGSAADANRIEMSIPWSAIGVDDPAKAKLRFRLSDGSAMLNPDQGDWAPDFADSSFVYTDGAFLSGTIGNLCTNGHFENLDTAAARPLPQGWSVSTNHAVTCQISEDAFSGKYSISINADGNNPSGFTSPCYPINRGLVKFKYKVNSSNSDGKNLKFFVIGLAGDNNSELIRSEFSPPQPHVADQKWHDASIEFNFSQIQVSTCLLAARINENSGHHAAPGDWLIDAVELYQISTGPLASIANVWSEKPCSVQGEQFIISAWIENNGDAPIRNLNVRLDADLNINDALKVIPTLQCGEFERLDWNVKAVTPGRKQVVISIESDNSSQKDSYTLLVLDKGQTFTRQQLCTDELGFFRILDKPVTLQTGNHDSIKAITHKTSSEIEHNLYGICTQLPRSKDYEMPFLAGNLIDSNPDTCWSSQQNSSQYPGSPPHAIIELDSTYSISSLNLVPYWENTDFPRGFSLSVSSDGKRWKEVLKIKNHNFSRSGPKQGDKFIQQFPLPKIVSARFVKVAFDRLPLAGGNYAEVSQGYKARLSGIEILDTNGNNIALVDLGAKADVSDFFTAWQSTAKTVNESFQSIFDIGLKWVRVGQWGDQTEWAAVEREPGVFKMDPATDAAIQKLSDNRVDILYGLNYGNHLYNEEGHTPWLNIGPIYEEGHPFYQNNGPKNETEREAFVRYVDFVVRKYKDRVKYWELWNEENGWYPVTTGVTSFQPELYGKLLYAVSKHLKSIDPDLQMMFGGTAAPAPKTTEIALREGASPYLDLTAFHPYGIDKPEGGMGTMEFNSKGENLGQTREQTGWNCMEDIIAGVKQPFVKAGNPDIKVWVNEFGTNVNGRDFSYHPPIGEFACSKWIMRMYLYNAWLDVPTAWWALYNDNMSQDWGIIEQKTYGLRPMSYALQNVCSVVSDVTPIKEIPYIFDGPAKSLKVIAFQRTNANEKLFLIWDTSTCDDEIHTYTGTLQFKLTSQKPQSVTITDIYWGLSQQANWSFTENHIILDNLIVKDYPLVIICRE